MAGYKSTRGLNVDKTNFVIFHSPKKVEVQVIIKFMKKKITCTTVVKFLGVLLNAHLSWK